MKGAGWGWVWVLLAGWGVAAVGCGRTPRATGLLSQDGYVWQRDWNSNVIASLADHASHFRRVVLLGAEVSWVSSQPRVTRVAFRADAATNASVGLALRIGPYAGPFRSDDTIARGLVTTARSLVDEARRQGVEPVEVQVDFDCAESRLDGYRVWVELLRRELKPVPLVVTALPSWLKRDSFAPLVRAADGFVLQVHSIERPRSPDQGFQLCDPEQALRFVEVAARAGSPFRVALPSYGYLVAFGTNGQFLGASAEAGSPERPPGTVWRELAADPVAMSRLVRTWRGDRPAAMEGVIWYRLPMPGDRLNWRWPTLAAVMAGESPAVQVGASGRVAEPGLIEIEVRNEGTADLRGPLEVRARWSGSRSLGGDGIRGFEAISAGAGEMLFTNPICRLRAGEAARIGWVRFEGEVPGDFGVSLADPSPP